MAGLDFSALKGLQKDLNNRGSGGQYFYANKIEGETDIRVLPPLPHYNGVYFLEQLVYWINNEFYVSPKTFDKDCPIDEEIEDAMALKDPDINELLKDKKKLSRRSRFLVPILVINNIKVDEDDEITSYDVEGGKAKIMICGSMLIKALNRNILSKNYQNGTPEGMLHRVKGYNITINKEGKSLDTEYTAIGWTIPMEIDKKFYEESTVPDIIKITQDDIKSDDYLRAVIRNYLYGEDMPKDSKKEAEEDKKETKNAASNFRGSAKKEVEEDTKTLKKKKVDEEDDEDVKPSKKKTFDEEFVDDEDPETELKPSKKKKVDDDEEEDKKPSKKRNLFKDLEDVD